MRRILRRHPPILRPEAPLPERAASLLRRLEALRDAYGADAGASKLAILETLSASRLSTSSQVLRLHECLCFLRAYPDDRRVLGQVEGMLAAFARRPDLRRHRAALADTGIAGTEIRFRFFARTAVWLARRWPERLLVDWPEFDDKERLVPFLPLLVHYGETPALDEWDMSVRAWIRRLKGRDETDAAFLIRRLASLEADAMVRERIYEDLQIPLRLTPGPETPSRTRARHASSPVVFVSEGIPRSRPRLPQDARQTPRGVREVRGDEARSLIGLARAAMIARQRDLDIFSYASPHDVRLVEWDGGLQFACFGALPERRLLLESVYGFLTLVNGVPVGYVLASALFGSSEIAYNVFDTYRGGESAKIYGRVMATVRHLFRSDAFTVFPYQLGQDNREAIDSGAWWFYQKIGFVPQNAEALRLMRSELARMKRNPRHRSSAATLRALADHNVYYFLSRARWDVIGADYFPDVGLKITDYMAGRFGSDREKATRVCSKEAARALGLRSLAGFSPGERTAWDRWAPLVLILPGLDRWSHAGRRALVAIVRAKGGRRESDFVTLFDRHRPLRRAILRLTGWKPPAR